MELEPYSETKRDLIEARLIAEANKRELLERTNHGIQVIAYYLVKEQVCTIYVHDSRTNNSVEFIVKPDEVMEVFNHPFAHPDANIEPYLQSQNGEGYGS